ncbi:terpenoid cyclases/Protein prenyltransferase [Xylariaceae sp. FL0255]|nr:terpenoid cyclases/Protein prenyltransferase [Xylariaceae sp. FL0255]
MTYLPTFYIITTAPIPSPSVCLSFESTMAATPATEAPAEPALDGPRHIRFWLRCLRTILPHHYTSNDSTRLALGFFILSALDLLAPSSPDQSKRKSLLTFEERNHLHAWILSLQHPYGGFCGSPHHVWPTGLTDAWDPHTDTFVARDPENANIAATCFALLCLGILADDDGHGSDAFRGVHRVRTLRWLKKLQREDGSFGENITADGQIVGSRDMRYCYVAAIIRWALGGGEGDDKSLDFNVEALVNHIRSGQTFDGGMGESSTHEGHGGYAYCAVAALSLLDLANPDPSLPPNHYVQTGIPSIPSLVRFLVNRQVAYTEIDQDDEIDEETANHPLPDLSSLSLDPTIATPNVIGFNGRLNKLPDTCYVWWNSGALAILGEAQFIANLPVRRFILDKTQHLVGGFAKYPGGPPDMYHAYMGLAALGTLAGDGSSEPGMRKFDARLCASADTVARMSRARETLLAPPSDSDSDEN